jgi:hypothetical protein
MMPVGAPGAMPAHVPSRVPVRSGAPVCVRARLPILAAAMALAVTALLLGAVVGERPGLAAQVVVPPGKAFHVEGMDRPFRHGEHQGVRCGDCHRADERHRATRRWAARDCAACHHGEAAVAGCTSCHQPAAFAAPRWTTTAMSLSVWSDPRVRSVAFDHGRHAAVGCLDCHRGGMDLPPQDCATCHVDHHRPEAQCAHCHRAPDSAVHPMAAHATCTGAGCHAVEVTTRPMLSRQFCLVCHDDQSDHRPGRVCVDCHIKPVNPRVTPRANGGR